MALRMTAVLVGVDPFPYGRSVREREIATREEK